MGIGLVLEGGGLRGLFTSGVLDVLMENGLTFDSAVGVSAGAVFGSNLKSKQIGRGIRYNLNYSKNWHYKGLRSLLLTGDAFGADFCYHKLPTELDIFDTKTFTDNPMNFYAVTTDIESGLPHYQKLTDGAFNDLEYVRASASMPIVSNIVNIDEHKYLDGGITDSIPLEFMEKQGFSRNVVVLTQPIDYVKQPYKIMPFIKLKYHKFPNLIEKIGTRHTMYNAQTAYVRQKEAEGACFVIRPEHSVAISAMETDSKEISRVYEHGREVATKLLEDLKDFVITQQ